jgi:Flp pilus assembly protein TadG
MIRRARIIADQRGTSALEFAIVGPVFLSLIVGLIYGCLLLFTMASMQYAVEEGSRCASVKTTICTSSASIIAYTQAAYLGPFTVPSFTSTTAACGHSVTGSTNFAFDIGLAGLTVPLSATACFP